MQPLTPDFVGAQLRLFAMALIAYLSGKGVFTPVDAGFAAAVVTSLGPIAVPYVVSTVANWGVIKVPANLVITKDDIQAASGNGSAPAKDVIAVAKHAAPLLLLCLLLLPLGACTAMQKTVTTNVAAAVVRSVPDLQSRTAYVCKFVPYADVAAAILKVDTGAIGDVARGICDALKTQTVTYGIMAREPTYKGVILRGKFVP